jgi:hypothetical protein
MGASWFEQKGAAALVLVIDIGEMLERGRSRREPLHVLPDTVSRGSFPTSFSLAFSSLVLICYCVGHPCGRETVLSGQQINCSSLVA